MKYGTIGIAGTVCEDLDGRAYKQGSQSLETLMRGEVVIWSVPLTEMDSRWLSIFRRSLSAEESARADAFYRETDHIHYTVAHTLQRAMLFHYLNKPVRLCRNSWGKPEIDDTDNTLRFSLTHTQGLVACGVTLIDDLGIDAEAEDRSMDHARFAADCFAPAEAAFLRSLPPASRSEAFFTLWTLKEAFLKAIGRGLDLPLADFAFSLDSFAFSCMPSLGVDAARWQFASMRLGANHQMAVARSCPCGIEMKLRHCLVVAEKLASVSATVNDRVWTA